MDNKPVMPSHVTEHIPLFDRFASGISKFTAKAWFFVSCLFIVLLWAPSYFVIRNTDTWQLIINTTTTIFTFLLVSLLQNTQTRDTVAIHRKLNAMADGLADLMDEYSRELDSERKKDLVKDITELRAAVGIEQIESS